MRSSDRWRRGSLACAGAVAALGVALIGSSAHGQGKRKKNAPAPSASASTAPPAKKKPTGPRPVKRVIDAIELGVGPKLPFQGSVRLKLVSGHQGAPLTYYWGGRCKGTKLSKSRLDLLYRAMRDRLAVEIPSRPIRYKRRVFLCMESIRLINR